MHMPSTVPGTELEINRCGLSLPHSLSKNRGELWGEKGIFVEAHKKGGFEVVEKLEMEEIPRRDKNKQIQISKQRPKGRFIWSNAHR